MAVLQAATLKRYQDTDFTEAPLLYTFEREETEEEILNKWTAKGQLASAMGTRRIGSRNAILMAFQRGGGMLRSKL